MVGASQFVCDNSTYFQPPIKILRRPLANFCESSRWRIGRWLRQLEDHRYLWRLQQTAWKSAVIHSHFADCGWNHHGWIRRLGRPHIVSLYGWDYLFRPAGFPDEKHALAALWTAANLFLCEGAYGSQRLIGMGCPDTKVQVQHLGVAIAEIPFHQRSKRPSELKLLQIAAFVEKKGQRFTIEAVLRALPECPSLTLTLVGPDPYGIRAELEAKIPPAARQHFNFINSIDHDRLYEFLHDYQVFIHPSCHVAPSRYAAGGDCEGGAPVVLLEAQAAGLPVIATRHCDIPEEVVDGKTGLLADEKDVETLARHIHRFYHMAQAEYDVFARAARAHVEEHYDIAHNAAHLVGIYRQVIQEKVGRTVNP